MDNPLRRFFSPPEKLLQGHVKEGMTLADLGCGVGYHALTAAKMVGQAGKVYAVDIDEKAITAVTKKATKKGLSGVVDARVSSASNLSFIPSRTIDLVIAKGLICCMHDHQGAIREIHRALKPSGMVYFSVRKVRGKKKDARLVDKEEWAGMLSQFGIETQGNGLINWWAWVRENTERSALSASRMDAVPPTTHRELTT